MMEEIAILDIELANRLLAKGFELRWIKQGKIAIIFFFRDTAELYIEIDKYLEETEKPS